MSLFKLPLIVGATLGLHAASTAPNPPPLAAERRMKPTKLEFMLTSSLFRNAQKVRGVYWFAAIAEAAIIAGHLGPYPAIPPPRICSMLLLGANPDAVRVTPLLAVGSALIASGALFRLLCYRALGRHFTFEMGIARDHKLVTDGPYSVVRHPSYTGAVMAYVGLLCYYGSPGSWFMECVFKGTTRGKIFGISYAFLMSLVVAGLLSRISREDDGLKNEFGREWADWFAVVPYALIPGIY
ncbi:hypothetical protein B0H13DRAFT_1593747 [Mycena leptocephala]|nr:hypothetical protein B0H13DRAFT_1593747 [Mycena leptocephala]